MKQTFVLGCLFAVLLLTTFVVAEDHAPEDHAPEDHAPAGKPSGPPPNMRHTRQANEQHDTHGPPPPMKPHDSTHDN